MNRQHPAAMACALLWAAALLASPASAQPKSPDHAAHHAASPAAADVNQADMAEGEVRRIDKEGGKVTLRHGEIKSLDMPPMTMVFAVRDKTLLDSLKAGDRVRFKAVNEAGKYIVTEIQPQR
jgi:Cu(I)/Ag(I) efflux system periplasmic protein CusF